MTHYVPHLDLMVTFSCDSYSCLSIFQKDFRSRGSDSPLYGKDNNEKCFICGKSAKVRMQIYKNKWREVMIDAIFQSPRFGLVNN